MKGCNKCKQWKELEEFGSDKTKKSGISSNCKECRINYQKQYYKNNIKYEREYDKQRQNLPVNGNKSTKTTQEMKLYEEARKSKNGNIECKCVYCDNGFEPTRGQIKNRLESINGDVRNGSGECRLYCSENCKENCPVYGKKSGSEDQKPPRNREIQKEVRDMRIEVDNYTCQNCKTHQDDLEESLECHHIGPINESPMTSGDVDECKMVCKECHKEIHQKPGCTYNELRCQVKQEE